MLSLREPRRRGASTGTVLLPEPVHPEGARVRRHRDSTFSAEAAALRIATRRTPHRHKIAINTARAVDN